MEHDTWILQDILTDSDVSTVYSDMITLNRNTDNRSISIGSFNSLDTVEMIRSHSKDINDDQQGPELVQESKREQERELTQENKLQIAFETNEKTKYMKRDIVDTPRFETEKIKRKREQPIAKRRKTPTPKTFYKILKGNQNVWECTSSQNIQ